MSYDTPADNRAFREAEDFPYRLLSDVDGAVTAAYGAARPPDHPYPDFPRRVSYVIDPDGRVAATYEVTDVTTHPDEVLADLRGLVADRGD